MSDRSLRASAAAGLCVFIALCAGVRAARAQSASDAGAPGGGGPLPTTDADAAPGPIVTPGATEPLNATTGSGPGLFAESQAASTGPTPSDAGAAKAPFMLNGYVRGDVFIGKVQDQRAAEMK